MLTLDNNRVDSLAAKISLGWTRAFSTMFPQFLDYAAGNYMNYCSGADVIQMNDRLTSFAGYAHIIKNPRGRHSNVNKNA